MERAFATAPEGAERERLQQRLRSLISEAQQAGELWTRDWDAFPLPVEARITAQQGNSNSSQQSYHTSVAPVHVTARDRSPEYRCAGLTLPATES